MGGFHKGNWREGGGKKWRARPAGTWQLALRPSQRCPVTTSESRSDRLRRWQLAAVVVAQAFQNTTAFQPVAEGWRACGKQGKHKTR